MQKLTLRNMILKERRGMQRAGYVGMLLLIAGCKDLTRDPGLPAGTPDPAMYNTAEGAIGLRAAAVSDLNVALPQYLLDAGLLSDELSDRAISGSTISQAGLSVFDPLDQRILPEGGNSATDDLDGRRSYALLQNVRGAANVALGALAMYDTADIRLPMQRVMRGELYALEAYAEILLAEMFCSGVPLSTLDFKQDFTYLPSSSAAQVYTDASTKLDSTLVLAAASDSVVNLARVLKGRAQLEFGNYVAAADDVSSVPTAFQYRLTIGVALEGGHALSTLLHGGSDQPGTASDREGINGLPFLSSGDPRAATTVTCQPPSAQCPVTPLTMPAKYFSVVTSAGYAPFVVASGIEARLIEAEAALHTNPNSTQWLTILNTLRTTGTATTIPAQTLFDTLGVTQCSGAYRTCGSDQDGSGNDPRWGQPAGGFPGYTITATDKIPGADMIPAPDGDNVQNYCFNHSRYTPCWNDTMVVLTLVKPAYPQWNAGIGGVSGLAPLADSGAALTGAAAGAARIAELFHERAYWLFMTGHRQGDLRRLIRQYGSQYSQFRSQQQVYPTGLYTIPSSGRFGSDVTAPIPTTEYANPNYHGCLDRNA